MSNPKNPDRQFDIRTLDSFIANGKVKASDYEKHLKSIPDDAGNFQVVAIEENDETEA